MDWDAIGAIGEVVGALAVVATLIYLSRQIRSMQTSAYFQGLVAVQDADIELRKLSAEYAETIAKANAGELLSDAERYRVKNVYEAHAGFAFHYDLVEYLEGGDQRHVRALTFAKTLVENPAFLNLFHATDWQTPEYVRWRKIVDEKLSSFGDR